MRIHFGIKSFKSSAAFSLPEVAIAVAIAALGIISILGIIPTGLENVRKAGNAIATARIYQQMLGELQAADWGNEQGGGLGWTKLSEYDGARRYFDGEGTPLGVPGVGLNDALQMQLAYVAEYEFAGGAQGPLLSGGASAAVGQNNDLKNVRIHIAVTPNQGYVFEDKTGGKHEKRAFTVARQF
ncbi:Verru_Chthon cassette protein B [Verrucomicrobium sp. BvORR034]|uniref:Verru_Chthon cassette protein B n=1 Tax=Verrucomicrobium sp. BvORR034 TaxID=1396418 RepID=UPI0006798615|nr:Verru_Chthon cassette protein B [Verrucomicrobium sp. BvORR034]